MNRLRLALCLGFVVLTFHASGAPIQLRVRTPALPAGTSPPPIAVHISGGLEAQQIDKLLQTNGDALEIDLPPGVWHVTPRAAGYFGETRAVVTPYAGVTLELELWPAATLRAILSPRSPRKQVVVRFAPVVAEGGEAGFPATAADCNVDGRHVECVVPAGLIDYSLRSFGDIPIYRWNQTVPAGEAVDLGFIEFRKGASLVGKITTPANMRLPAGERVRVALAPDVPGAVRPEETARVRTASVTAMADARGRFVFEGVAPGAYVLSASARGLISERRVVTVVAGLEAELREPLALSAPLTLNVRIDPPIDPWRQPWTVGLLRSDLRARVESLVATDVADSDGSWTRGELPPGDYTLKIRRPQGVWHSRGLSLSESAVVSVTIPLVRVAGELRLGSDPIAGSLWFGGENGQISVPVKTTPEGTFRAVLPAVEENVWKEVDIVAERPAVRTTVTDVRLSEPNDRGISTVIIALPHNRLYGEVTTEEGQPISDATVYAQRLGTEPLLRVDVDEAGAFAFNGLAAGTYSVRAMGAHGKSDAAEIAIESGDDEYMRVVLKRETEVSGTVVSPHGPVPGARVAIYPEDRSGFGVLPSGRTDFEGRFNVRVEQAATPMTVTVAAPGYAYRMFTLPERPAESLVIPVQQRGGRLVIEDAGEGDGATLVLFRDSAFVSLGSLHGQGIAFRRGSDVTLDSLDPGHYDVCVAGAREAAVLARSVRSAPRCRGGYVAADGTLTLQAHR